MLDDAGANVSVYKNCFIAQKHGCLSELLRRSASDTGIEIKSIPAFQRNVLTLHRPSVICLTCHCCPSIDHVVNQTLACTFTSDYKFNYSDTLA